jgi:hypothetical protein
MLNLYVLTNAYKFNGYCNFRKIRGCDLVIDFLKKNFKFRWFTKRRLYEVYLYGEVFFVNKKLDTFERADDIIDFLSFICTN